MFSLHILFGREGCGTVPGYLKFSFIYDYLSQIYLFVFQGEAWKIYATFLAGGGKLNGSNLLALKIPL